jgi:hypothetical protein
MKAFNLCSGRHSCHTTLQFFIFIPHLLFPYLHLISLSQLHNDSKQIQVKPNSRASELGIKTGDLILASSTPDSAAGVKMWLHANSTLSAVRAAVSKRFESGRADVTLLLERSLGSIDSSILPSVYVTAASLATCKRPLGINVVEGKGHESGPALFVQEVVAGGGAAKSDLKVFRNVFHLLCRRSLCDLFEIRL